MDEACIVELSKHEIARRLNGMSYSKYKVRFDPEENLWVVMAYDENGPPDSHTFLTITPTGQVTGFEGGG